MWIKGIVTVLLAGSNAPAEATSFWHRDEYCGKYDIDERHTDRHSDGLGHGLQVDINRLVKCESINLMVEHGWHHNNHGKDPIGPKGVHDLVEHLKGHPNVHYLNLMNNEIGDEGAKAIGELLKENKGIVELHLDGNGITCDGMAYIAEGLKVNRALKTLELDYNSVGDVGAQELAEVLKVNDVLIEVYLTHNNVTDKGALAIAEVVESGNGVIRRVRLRDNKVSEIVMSEYTKVFNKPKVHIPHSARKHYNEEPIAEGWTEEL